MLFVEETHAVVGSKEEEMEAAYREGWMRLLGDTSDARLLWYLNVAHGAGRSYRVVTITAVRDGSAWERLARRVQAGDLREWARETDRLRHDVRGRILVDLDFSQLSVDLESLSTTPRQGGFGTLYMQDTVWPYPGKLTEYERAARSIYARSLERADGASERPRTLTIEGAFRTMPGGGGHPEVVLMQKVHDLGWLLHLLGNDLPPEMKRRGSWMHDALAYRDRWNSRLLRTAPWSPLQ